MRRALGNQAGWPSLAEWCVSWVSAEPSGFIFLGSGEEALVHIQHRAINDAKLPVSAGALIKISGFKVKSHHHGFDDDDDDDHDRR